MKLEVQDLSVAYGPHTAVHEVSFSLQPGDILGLVGESGSGKSTVVNGLLRLLGPPARITSGRVTLGDLDLLKADDDAIRASRWRDVSLVPQSALSALNPVLTVGAHFADTLPDLDPLPALKSVGLEPHVLDRYPHELSGGMRQRVALALALAPQPPVLVMDEPTTALDVVVERDILRTMLRLQRQRGFSVLFITHDLALLLQFATHIGVLYGGHLVEMGSAQALRDGARHPYTQALLAAIPPGVDEDREPESLPGVPPRIDAPEPGCPFEPRCRLATAACKAEVPPLTLRAEGHHVACGNVP